jgi:hypothetical protein
MKWVQNKVEEGENGCGGRCGIKRMRKKVDIESGE